MRKLILAGFAVATVAILAGAAVAEGAGGAADTAPIHGLAPPLPVPPSSLQQQVFGDLADAAARPPIIREVGR